jgi:hypothetical protein
MRAFFPVLFRVLSGRQNLKILRPIVCLVRVAMMDVLAFRERSPEHLLCDETMFTDLSTFDG